MHVHAHLARSANPPTLKLQAVYRPLAAACEHIENAAGQLGSHYNVIRRDARTLEQAEQFSDRSRDPASPPARRSQARSTSSMRWQPAHWLRHRLSSRRPHPSSLLLPSLRHRHSLRRCRLASFWRQVAHASRTARESMPATCGREGSDRGERGRAAQSSRHKPARFDARSLASSRRSASRFRASC